MPRIGKREKKLKVAKQISRPKACSTMGMTAQGLNSGLSRTRRESISCGSFLHRSPTGAVRRLRPRMERLRGSAGRRRHSIIPKRT